MSGGWLEHTLSCADLSSWVAIMRIFWQFWYQKIQRFNDAVDKPFLIRTRKFACRSAADCSKPPVQVRVLWNFVNMTCVTWKFLWLLFAPVKPEPFLLPATFEGAWQGIPHASVVGPWSENFTFAITRNKSSSDDFDNYLFEANLPFDASPAFHEFWSWQRSYFRVSGEDRGRLLHCPGPRNPKLQRVAMMQAFRGSQDEVTFCLRKWPGYIDSQHPFPFKTLDCYHQGPIQGCGCFNWTLRADPVEDTLDYQVSMAGSPGHARSQHMWVKLHRIPFLPSISGFPGTGKDFRCEYASRDEHQTQLASCPFAQNWRPSKRANVLTSGSFQHCYNLDLKSGLVLEWDLDLQNSMLHVQISAWSDVADYVSIGFRPLGGSSSNLARDAGTGREMRFGMAGADIVLGHSDGIQQYYAAQYSGMPEPDESLHISKAFTQRKEGRLYLQFQRPLVGGRLQRSFGINASIASNVSDMMWAVGKWDADAAVPRYHNIFRGWREVNWTDPEFDARPLLSLRPYKCTDGGVTGVVYPWVWANQINVMWHVSNWVSNLYRSDFRLYRCRHT